MPNNLFRNIPSVNELLESPPLRSLVDKVSHNVVVAEVRTFLDPMRADIQTATKDIHVPSAGELAERIAGWIVTEQQPRLRPVINATGIILHTGLGRAPLAQAAIDEMAVVAGGYATVEVDPDSGQRSQRVRTVEKLLTELTGAEAATVVNNNAGATMLALAALAQGREVVVSRGQLIEIGGSYRLPEVMETSGAKLREVGTTNKTRIGDFDSACHEQTGALLRVHTSNYQVVGFTESPSLEELVALGRRRGVPVIDDIGSGALIDFAKYGLAGEPVASDSIAAGADVVLFSGDKLLGGPQCGIAVGRREVIEKLLAHPLMRALRVDKVTLAALAATLRLWRDPLTAELHVPLLTLVATSVENLKNRAERLVPQLAACSVVGTAEVVEGSTYLGGGAVPGQLLPTWCVALTPAKESVDRLAELLRRQTPSVFGRVHQNRLLLDLRSVLPSQDALLAETTSRCQWEHA
ncbi:MAG: L-seryl-tRNA(Sec) selenium transferase [Planctomycetales bacterium]|nr:L-seryl-tRNA(Sec) selenium transferase [Planctomycetales bacterium]